MYWNVRVTSDLSKIIYYGYKIDFYKVTVPP